MSFAFVFPGQGSQSIGMLSELAKESEQVISTFTEASDVLGYDLWNLVSNGPENELNQTARTQPAMLAAGIAVWRTWQASTDLSPAYFAGHSLGEYSALVAAGALEFSDAIKLVEQRGLFMQQAVPEGTGAMAAILGLDDDKVIAICSEAAQAGIVEAVNFNSPGQVVIAGSTEAVNQATELAKSAGAKRALLLPVSVPSHCALMKPAAERLSAMLSDISVSLPKTPVIHNANVASASSEEEIKDLLAKQLYSPVRWVETIASFSQNDVSHIIECGPGKVLAGLTKRIDKSLVGLPIYDTTTLNTVIEKLGE